MRMAGVRFCLPFGVEIEGKRYRRGVMRRVRTKDELEIQGRDEVGMNTRYRDILLLSRVIEEMEGEEGVGSVMIEELYEADFLYLQLLYKKLNGEVEEIGKVECPECGCKIEVEMERLYEDMRVYREEVV